MWGKDRLREYATKLDGYYFDKNLKETILVLKIRNKRTTFPVSIKEIFSYKNYLSALHPIDLCIIGILANEENVESISRNSSFVMAPDNYFMVKIQPFLEIQGREFKESNEIIKLKIKNIDKIIYVSAKELFNNKKLISALKYYDALSLGFSLSVSESDTSQMIMQQRSTYNPFQTFINSIFLTFFILSILLVGQFFSFPDVVQLINLHGEILFLPFLIMLFSYINDNLSLFESNRILMIVIIIGTVFISYFSWIIGLPYPDNDNKVMAFGILHQIIMHNSVRFIFPLAISAIAYILLKGFPHKLTYYFQNRLIATSMHACLFFMSAFCICFTLNIANYSIIDLIYTLICLLILSPFKIPSNKQ